MPKIKKKDKKHKAGYKELSIGTRVRLPEFGDLLFKVIDEYDDGILVTAIMHENSNSASQPTHFIEDKRFQMLTVV